MEKIIVCSGSLCFILVLFIEHIVVVSNLLRFFESHRGNPIMILLIEIGYFDTIWVMRASMWLIDDTYDVIFGDFNIVSDIYICSHNTHLYHFFIANFYTHVYEHVK